MKRTFVCSLCLYHNGILGGGLYVDETSVTYRTGKLTVAPMYRNLVLPLAEIERVEWKWVIFPVATFYMRNGERYKFLIYNKKGFEKCLEEKKII